MAKFKSFWSQLDIVTQAIVCINLLFYIVSIIKNHMSAITGLSRSNMLQTFAVTGDNNVLSILTAMFSHASFMHLLMNMMTLMLLSPILTKYVPTSVYATTYIISGLVGNILTRWSQPHMVTMGASGAIYGVIGFLLVIIIISNFTTYFQGLKRMTNMIFIVVGVNIFYTFCDTHINVVAHLSGLGIGILIAGIFAWRHTQQSRG